MLNKKNLVLLLILVFAAFLRLWHLGTYPALNADEAAIGYNVWSLLETGADEHGNSWPIHFQSFNDYKPGLYFYLVLPLVKLLGLNEWSVRLPNALLGVTTAYLVYLLVVKLFDNVKTPDIKHRASITALLSAFMLAISPWHLHFSRGGWEVNTATFFITLGVYLFLKGIKNLPLLMLSVISFSLSMYTYHAARVVVPLLGMGLIIIYRSEFKKQLVNLAIVGLIGIVSLTPLIKDFLRPNVISRAAGVGLFADPGPLNRINEQRGEHGDFTAVIPKVFHNKAVNYGLAFIDNWGEHFHGEFLFLSGDIIERNRVPETGQMYLINLLFLIAGLVGMVLLISSKSHPRMKRSEEIRSGDVFALRRAGYVATHQNDTKKGVYVLLLWLLVAPTAAALTFQSPHALRAQNMVIPLVIISAYGLVYLSLQFHKLIKNKRLLDMIFVVFVLFYAWNFTSYLHNYWAHMAKQYPFSSQYGVKELVEYIKENEEGFDKVLVTDRYDQPYIQFLFYSKYSPEKFQEDHELTPRDEYGFSTVKEFGKYHFGNIVWDRDQPLNPNSLIIGTPEEIPNEANIVKEIYGSNGYKYFEVVAN